MVDVFKIIKLNIFKMWLLMLWCFLALCQNLNADTLDEVLRLTFSTNKQLLLSRTQLQSSKTAIDISKSALGLNFSASINGSRGWNINESAKSDSYSSSLTGSYNISDGNLSKSRVLIDEALYKIAKLQLQELEQKVLLDERMAKLEQRYAMQYASMETAVAGLKDTGEYLTEMLKSKD